MRILYVLHQFFPEFGGGTERVTLNLARCAQRAGHYVHILSCHVNASADSCESSGTLHGAEELLFEGIPVTRVARHALPVTGDFSLDVDSLLVTAMSSWMLERAFDICHVMHGMRMASAILAAQHSKLPYLLTLTDFFMACPRINMVTLKNELCDGPCQASQCIRQCMTAPWDDASMTDRYLQASDILSSACVRIAPSEFVAERFRSAFPECEFSVIPHGLDLLSLMDRIVSEEEDDATSDTLTLGFVGTIVPQKGLAPLLRAFTKVKGAGICIKVIGGFHADKAYQTEIVGLASNDSRIQLHGHCTSSEVGSLMASLDLLCLPSLVPESFSLVLHEAAALGVPALVSNLGAPAQKIAKNGAGKVLPANDVKSWAQAIQSVLEDRKVLQTWRDKLELPLRMEEEAFFYESLYRRFLNTR